MPASPVAATDLMKYRCARKKISSIGTRLITLPAISSVHSVACAPWNVASPSGSTSLVGRGHGWPVDAGPVDDWHVMCHIESRVEGDGEDHCDLPGSARSGGHLTGQVTRLAGLACIEVNLPS